MTAFIESTAVLAAIYGLLVLSLNLQYGLTGLLNFGQALFFAVGGYAVAIGQTHGWPLWVPILAGPLAGALFGWLLALPAKRMSQAAWALMSLAVSELFLALMQTQQGIAGGTTGTFGIPYMGLLPALLTLLVLIAITLAVVERMRRSQFGRIIRTIREDGLLATSLGRDVRRFQAVVLMVGGAVAGSAGVVYAHWITFISPDSFSLGETLLVWAMMIIGGLGNNVAALAGAVVLEGMFVGTRFLPSALLSGQTFATARLVLIGLLLVVMLQFRPQGVLPERKRRYRAPS